MMTKEFFAAQIERLTDGFCLNTSNDRFPSRIRIYWKQLNHIPEDKLENAISNILRNEERFPTIAKIFDYLKSDSTFLSFFDSKINQHCVYCSSSGVIFATKDRKKYVFKCEYCSNAENNYPVWFSYLSNNGFLMDESRLKNWDYEDKEVLAKGVIFLGSKKLFDKVPDHVKYEIKRLQEAGWKPVSF